MSFLEFTFSCQTKDGNGKSDSNHISKIGIDDTMQNLNKVNYSKDSSYVDSDSEYFQENMIEYKTGMDFPINDEKRFINADFFDININPEGNYDDLKKQIINKRIEFQQKYLSVEYQSNRQMVVDQARNYITEILLNRIIPFWYGMQWSLSGYSEIPNNGEVGCSYFISNTLKHCGFKLNRYKLAQQNTKDIAISLQPDTNILILQGKGTISTVKNYFKAHKREGLYYVGIDCHVGYLLFRKNELFFIHSNYAYPMIVLAEFTEQSQVFMSNNYYIADITWNDKLIAKWILNEEIQILKN